ncbi:MAG: glycosyltransferase family 39 protein [Chloroflexota bacterium]
MTYTENRFDFRLRKYWWVAACTIILLLGGTFRLVALQDVPPGLAQDEVLNADIVSFIRGGEHAFFFRHGYGHEPLYHYWSVPFQVLLGDNFLSIRLPAVVLGMLLIALTLRWARRDFGRIVALTAGFGLAVSWWPIIFSRIGLRPIMEPVLLVVAALVWPSFNGRLKTNGNIRAVGAGAVLGLAVYTYTAARVLFALPIVYGVYAGIMSWWTARQGPEKPGGSLSHTGLERDQSGNVSKITYRRQAIYATVALATMVLVSLPMFLTLHADPSLQQRVEQLSGPLDALLQGSLTPILSTTLATLGVFGVTGDPRWTYSVPGFPLFEPLAAVLFLLGLAVVLWRWRLPVYVYVLIWLGVGLIPSAVTPDAPSSVRLVGAMPVVYLLPGIGLAMIVSWFKKRAATTGEESSLFRTGFGLFVAVLALLAMGRTIRVGFLEWPSSLETRLKYQSVLLDISRDGRVVNSSPVVVDGFYEPIDDASLQRDFNGDPAARWVQTGDELGGAVVWPQGSDGTSYIYVPEFAPLDHALLTKAEIGETPVYRSESQPAYAVYSLPHPPAANGALALFVDDGFPIMSLLTVTPPDLKMGVEPFGSLTLFSSLAGRCWFTARPGDICSSNG